MVLSTVVVKSIYHSEKSQKLAFRAIALCQSEGREWGRVSKEKIKTPPSLFPDMRIGRFSLCAVHPCFFGGRGVVVG